MNSVSNEGKRKEKPLTLERLIIRMWQIDLYINGAILCLCNAPIHLYAIVIMHTDANGKRLFFFSLILDNNKTKNHLHWQTTN